MDNYHEPTVLISKAQIKRLEELLEWNWSRQTCYPASRQLWHKGHKAIGQCAVTALWIQEVYGGQLVKSKKYDHIWNLLPDKTEHDFSRSQFLGENIILPIDLKVARYSVLNGAPAIRAQTQQRYELLKRKLARFGY